MTDITRKAAEQESALMQILRGTDDNAKMRALEGFALKPTIKSDPQGDYSDYSTEVAPDSYDELRDAVDLGLITKEQIETLRQIWYDRSVRRER